MAEEFPRAWPKEPGVSAGLSVSQVSYPGQSLGREDLLEQEMATHSSILAWKIPWTEKAWRATVPGVTRVGHDLATKLPGHPRSTEVNPVWEGPGEVVRGTFLREGHLNCSLSFSVHFSLWPFSPPLGFFFFFFFHFLNTYFLKFYISQALFWE